MARAWRCHCSSETFIRQSKSSPKCCQNGNFEWKADIDELARTIPLGRTGTPDDIAAAVLYLASPAASWVTGEHLLVAGGRTQRSYQYEPRKT